MNEGAGGRGQDTINPDYTDDPINLLFGVTQCNSVMLRSSNSIDEISILFYSYSYFCTRQKIKRPAPKQQAALLITWQVL